MRRGRPTAPERGRQPERLLAPKCSARSGRIGHFTPSLVDGGRPCLMRWCGAVLFSGPEEGPASRRHMDRRPTHVAVPFGAPSASAFPEPQKGGVERDPVFGEGMELPRPSSWRSSMLMSAPWLWLLRCGRNIPVVWSVWVSPTPGTCIPALRDEELHAAISCSKCQAMVVCMHACQFSWVRHRG